MISTTSNPNVVSGLGIEIDENRVIIQPGVCRVGGKEVQVQQKATFEIPPAGSILVEKEPYVLSSDRPNTWAQGTHLKGCNSNSTVIPGCLVPGSVEVRLPDGTLVEKDRDYLIDDHWAVLGRTADGRISTDSQVLITYHIGLMRLDGIDITTSGKVLLVKGEATKNRCMPPPVGKGNTRLAHVYMPYHEPLIDPWQIFVAGPAYPEPDAAELARRGALVPKTIEKLRAGKPVTVVAWGDSVTCGCDATKPECQFPNLFASRLRERFPKATVKLVNAGIGGSNTNQRLPEIDQQVLSHHPDLVTMEYVNDMGLPLDQVKKNYEQAIAKIRAAGAELIIITPHFVMPEWMGHKHARGKEVRPAVDVIRKVAADAKCALADTSKRWEYLETEGIPYLTLIDSGINHPGDRGHELFVKDLMTFFP